MKDHFRIRQYCSLSRTLLMPLSLLFSLLLCLIININHINIADAFNVTTTTFGEGFSPLFSDFNILRSPDDKTVSLLLNRHSGSGFISSGYYNYGLFSANIKLPSKYSAGIVVAFYTSNTDLFPKGHDELDIEFLGNRQGLPWRFQTNFYGNGSTKRGREERYYLWFDPSKEFHRYSILWTSKNIIFYVDEIPIREVVRRDEMGGDWPSKPMALYATIWDASSWATDGGKYSVNYKFEPFVSEFKDLVLQGCKINPIQQTVTGNCHENTSKLEAADYATITQSQRSAKKKFRQKYMYYSYCYDTVRYPVPLPECVIVPTEKRLFKVTGRLKKALRIKFGKKPRNLHRHRGSGSGSSRSSQQSSVIHGGGSLQQSRVLVGGDGGGGGREKADI